MMVMKNATSRMGVAEAKARFSELLRNARNAPILIHNRGEEIAVVVDAAEWNRLQRLDGLAPTAGARLLARIAEIKEREGGGVDGFEPVRAEIQAADPFAKARSKRTSK